jgi:hypothetical protein
MARRKLAWFREATRAVSNILYLGVDGFGVGALAAQLVEDPRQLALLRFGDTDHRLRFAAGRPVG